MLPVLLCSLTLTACSRPMQVALTRPVSSDEAAIVSDNCFRSSAIDGLLSYHSMHRRGQTWRIWTIFGVRPDTRRDEDAFDLLSAATVLPHATWFISCGRSDALLAVNQEFAHELVVRGAAVNTRVTSGGHNWQSWNSAMPDLFSLAVKTLR